MNRIGRVFAAFLLRIGFPEPKVIYGKIEKECEKWNEKYAYGKSCEKCESMYLGEHQGSDFHGAYHGYQCVTCGHRQTYWKNAGLEAYYHCVSPLGGFHYMIPPLYVFPVGVLILIGVLVF